MNDKQKRAAASLKTALKKVLAANLRLLAYDGSVFVCPEELDVQGDPRGVFESLEEDGELVSPPELYADGGAGV